MVESTLGTMAGAVEWFSACGLLWGLCLNVGIGIPLIMFIIRHSACMCVCVCVCVSNTLVVFSAVSH